MIKLSSRAILIIILCTHSVAFNACKKSSNDSTIKKLLIAGKWQIADAIATTNYMGKDTTVNIYNEIKECDRDDFIEFDKKGTCTIDENTNKCADDGQVESGRWELLNDDTRLAIVDNNPDTMELEITSMEMKLKLTKLNSSGSPVTYLNTYKNIK